MSRRSHLTVTPLEDRSTPATFSYSPGTLTVTAATGDSLTVSLKQINNNTVPGFLHVQNGGTQVFDSLTYFPVKNLVVKPAAGAANYFVEVLSGVTLSNLNVTGAPSGTLVYLDAGAKVSGGFTFTGTGTGQDEVDLFSGSAVGGSAVIDLKGGNNLLRLGGGSIGGNLQVTAGAGLDEVQLFNGGSVTVGGSAQFNLGDGANVLHAINPDALTVGKNLAVTGGAGHDLVSFGTSAAALNVGGRLSLNLLGGDNETDLTGGTIGGSFRYAGGDGTDNVYFAAAGDLTIGGSFTAVPGNGYNLFRGESAHTVSVGTNLTYTGGDNADEFKLGDQQTFLSVGGNLTVNLGGAGDMEANLWTARGLDVGGNATFTAEGGHNTVILYGATTIGGGLAYNLGGGQNTIYVNDGGYDGTAVVGRGLSYVGGADHDAVNLDALTVGTNVVLTLGGAPSGFQAVRLGMSHDKPVVVNGSLRVNIGESDSYVGVFRTQVGGNLSVTTGNKSDQVDLDDSTILGSAAFNLGGGADQLNLDTNAKDINNALLTGEVHIGGALTVNAGAGDDVIDFSSTLPGGRVVVGGPVKLTGGAGQDTFKNWKAGNIYLGTKAEDFELGAGF